MSAQGARVAARRGRPSPVELALQGDRGDRASAADHRAPPCSCKVTAAPSAPGLRPGSGPTIGARTDTPCPITSTSRLSSCSSTTTDELVFDGSDPSSYVACHTAGDIRRALAAALTGDPGDDR